MERFALRNDQWDRIKNILPVRDGHVGGTAEDNRVCSSKRFSTALGLDVPGVICLSVSATGNQSINVSADGQKAAFSSVFSSFWPAIATTST